MSIIEVKNISKKYRIAHQQDGYLALRDVLINVVKNPLSFFRNLVFRHGAKEEFWALKDINLIVERGEAIGIIGPNGAGKSTFLKILSQITFPTTGEIKIKGKVASLLEVGTGFHPELTGRENIFLNGAILGMTKKEIRLKFKDIVEFAGVEKFIDTPVKRYSSGMHVRLAFSVAAHMEPDILLVDEVLAVGDVSFQKKCLGRMDEVTKKYGRTILFVSHNMTAVQNLCKRCILLEKGKIKKIGEAREVINYYLNQDNNDVGAGEYKHSKTDPLVNDSVELISTRLTDKDGRTRSDFGSIDDIYILIEYKIKKRLPVLLIDCSLRNEGGIVALHSTDNDSDEYIEKERTPGVYISHCQIPKNLLNIGKYFITVGGRTPRVEQFSRKSSRVEQFFHAKDVLSLTIRSTGGPTSIDSPRIGVVCPELVWKTKLK